MRSQRCFYVRSVELLEDRVAPASAGLATLHHTAVHHATVHHVVSRVPTHVGPALPQSAAKDPTPSLQTWFALEGPSGGPGGASFQDGIGLSRRIANVLIRSGSLINSIQLVYQQTSRGGAFEWHPQHGGNGGSLSVVTLAPGEYITRISGTYGNYYGQYVDSLHIDTNIRSNIMGGWGTSTVGVPFSYAATPGTQIIGFLGHSGALVDAIGVIIEPIGA